MLRCSESGKRISTILMGLFKADLYRALAVGFLLGTIAVFVFAGGEGAPGVVPSAVAAADR